MIKGKKVRLRPFRNDDWQITLQWRNDKTLTHSILSHPFPVTELLEREWFDNILKDKSNRSIYFGIEFIAKKELIGYVSLININWIDRICHFGILIGNDEYRGVGIGSEAMTIIINYAFNILNLRKITLQVVEGNKAMNLYKKVGFKQEGKLEKHHYYNGNYYDVYILSLIR